MTGLLNIAFSVLLLTALDPGGKANLVIQGQRVAVSGQTSVGGFRCVFDKETRNNAIAVQGGSNNGATLLLLSIPVKEFGCGNFLLNRDFQKTLKMDQHPAIVVDVLQLEFNGSAYAGRLNLTVAGKKKSLDNVLFRTHSERGSTMLRAHIKLRMSEWGLTPPSRFGGLVTVNEDLGIVVDLLL
jgi:hypothetical protein